MRFLTIFVFSFFLSEAAAQRSEMMVPGHNLYINKVLAANHIFPNATGAGIVVSVKERQFQLTDIDLKNRVLPNAINLIDPTAHATTVATLIGGAGISGTQGQGSAPGCKLISTAFGTNFTADADTFYRNQGITVQNHAYGWDNQNQYDANSRSFDHAVRINPTLVHVFSAGNEGQKAAMTGRYVGIPGVANLTGGFKMAKNALIVAAVDSFNQLQPFSSHGPAYDGRIKPDICAYGHSGTSESAALVSGAVAVMQQTYRERYGALPASCAVRAALIAGATDLLAPGPDFKSGWGSLDMRKSLQIINEKKIITGYLFPEDTLHLPIVFEKNLRNIKFTVVWDDETPENYSTIDKALYSDLDITIQTPEGKIVLPWVLKTHPQLDSLALPAGKGQDTLNNVEQISLDFPLPGVYDLTVCGRQLLDKTLFAVSWAADLKDHFLWEFPISGAPVVPNKEVLLQWTSDMDDAAAEFSWKPITQTNWITIAATVNIKNGYFRWRVPNYIGAAQVQCCSAGRCVVSDSFLISPAVSVKVGFNCPDSVLIFWNSSSSKLHYQVEGLGNQYLQYLFTTADTFVVLPRQAFPQTHFAVRAVDARSGIAGSRSAAPAIVQQGVACYFRQFYATLSQNSYPALFFSIGTVYSVAKISLQRIGQDSFVSLKQWNSPLENTLFQFTDENALPGIQRYRVVLTTLNGTPLYSDTLTVFVPSQEGWWVYPNPAPSGGKFQVISALPGELELRLFDLSGREVLRQPLEDVRNQISLNSLAAGVYIWEIRRGTQQVGKGKLVIYP